VTTAGLRAPIVFGGMTQAELDRAYDQGAWASNAEAVQARIMARSRNVATWMLPRPRRYGPAAEQVIDIFAPPGVCNAPVFILIHGGGWRLAMRESFYGAAPRITGAGGILAVVGFQCLPDVTMSQMAEQIRQAILCISSEVGALGGDRRKLHIVGHSSGAHLAAVMMTADFGDGLPRLAGGTLISGMYDLEPVLLSSRRHYVALSPEEADALSPIRHVRNISCPVSVWWGSDESPEFQRQSQMFANAVKDAALLRQSAMLPGRNHFEMLEELDDPNSLIVKALLTDRGG
jgi:arylformamidase